MGICLLMGYLVLALFAITLALLLNPNISETFFTELGRGVALTGFTLLVLLHFLTETNCTICKKTRSSGITSSIQQSIEA